MIEKKSLEDQLAMCICLYGILMLLFENQIFWWKFYNNQLNCNAKKAEIHFFFKWNHLLKEKRLQLDLHLQLETYYIDSSSVVMEMINWKKKNKTKQSNKQTTTKQKQKQTNKQETKQNKGIHNKKKTEQKKN